MPTKITDISIYRGDTVDFPTLRFREDGTDGAYLDLSSWTWSAQWRKFPDAASFLSLEVDSSSSNEGWIFVTAPSDVTSQMHSNGVWDLQGTHDGITETKVYGNTILTPDVTRDV